MYLQLAKAAGADTRDRIQVLDIEFSPTTTTSSGPEGVTVKSRPKDYYYIILLYNNTVKYYMILLLYHTVKSRPKDCESLFHTKKETSARLQCSLLYSYYYYYMLYFRTRTV